MVVAAFLCSGTFADGGLLLRGGLNFSGSTFDPEPSSTVDDGFRVGFNLGMLGDIPINEIVHLIIGGGFETKGFTLSQGSVEATYRFNYVTFPLLFSIGREVAIQLGVEPAFTVSSTAKDNQGNSADLTGVTGVDMNLCAQVVGQTPVSASGLGAFFGLGYSYGLVDTDDGDFLEAHNYVIRIFGGMKISFARSPASGL
jgi:hypothetical protein